jgi:Domain of unknown function (DUF5671)
MLRGLYRFYLYAVFIAMLLFATSGVIQLLTVLLQSVFKDPYNTPSGANLVQALVYSIVSLITAALFGGLHYWLIRRDMRNDPMAGNSAVRAFFLNAVELISLPLAVGSGTATISAIGQHNTGGLSSSAAFTITLLGLWLLLEWERRRVPASSGTALVFQRLHLYGTQLILLFILTFSWLQSMGQLVDKVLFGGAGALTTCAGSTGCQGPGIAAVLANVASTLWVVLFWIGYGWLSRNDTASVLRRVFHFIGFGFGIIAGLVGIYRGVTLIFLLAIFKESLPANSISGAFAEYDVISPLSLGMLVVGAYVIWLRNAVMKHPEERVSVFLTGLAIAAALSGVAFWSGCGLILLNILEKVFPSSTAVTPENWASAVALVIAGIAYIPLGLLLRILGARAAFLVPLRGFTFVLFGGGILAAAIGGATALYAYGTAALGSALNNWVYVAHTGNAAFAIGVLIVCIYLWTSIREGFFAGIMKQQAAEVKPPVGEVHIVTPSLAQANGAAGPSAKETQATQAGQVTTVAITRSVGEIVDELLAGKISRDEAVARIEKVVK